MGSACHQYDRLNVPRMREHVHWRYFYNIVYYAVISSHPFPIRNSLLIVSTILTVMQSLYMERR